jgi:ketosteroid isomerase-like protein
MPGHVDLLRAMFEAFNRRDFEFALAHASPDIELHPALTELDVHDTYQGRSAVRSFFETITEPWESYVIEPTEFIESAENRVVVVEDWHARGRDGIRFDFELIDVYTFEDLLVRIDGFRDREAALEAARQVGA